jgi:hypothetical protein
MKNVIQQLAAGVLSGLVMGSSVLLYALNIIS